MQRTQYIGQVWMINWKKLVLNCELCLKYSQSKCNWNRHFSFKGASYLLIVDYTSRFMVVCKLSSMTEQHISTHCKQVFSKYCWLETLISDKGSCYTVEAFTNMMQEYGVNQITSSPYYPQSNGLAEKYVQIVENLFHKVKEERKACLNA